MEDGNQIKIDTVYIALKSGKEDNWKISIVNKIKKGKGKAIIIDCGKSFLKCSDFKRLMNLCDAYECHELEIQSSIPETIISANSLGIKTHIKTNPSESESIEVKPFLQRDQSTLKVLFHQGTIRSGDQIESEGDLFIYGDVNPGAIVSAQGNIIIWGKLLGIAHAGKGGDRKTKISALQLRPVQLRIADKAARGPSEKENIGIAEDALIESDEIIIKPTKALK